MTWILAQQRENDRVVFFTDDSEEKNILRYKKFLEYMKQYSVQNPIEFQNELDRFHIVQVNVITGEWKQIQKEYDSNIDFETLSKLNNVKEQQTDHHTLTVNKAKEHLNTIYGERKKQHGNDFFKTRR